MIGRRSGRRDCAGVEAMVEGVDVAADMAGMPACEEGYAAYEEEGGSIDPVVAGEE